MKIVSFSPNLMVKNVNKSIDFYCNILGFSLIQTVPESGTADWGMLEKNDFFIMLQKEESIKQEYPELNDQTFGGALTFYIRISDIHEFYEEINNKINVLHKMHKTFYGADEFAITDPDGFILVFSSTVEM